MIFAIDNVTSAINNVENLISSLTDIRPVLGAKLRVDTLEMNSHIRFPTTRAS